MPRARAAAALGRLMLAATSLDPLHGASVAIGLLTITLLIVGDKALGSVRALPVIHPPLLAMVVAIAVLATIDLEVSRLVVGPFPGQCLASPLIVVASALELVPLSVLGGVFVYTTIKVLWWRGAPEPDR